MDFNDFIKSVPDRINELIDSGPVPLQEWPTHKIRWSDKKRGVMRYKGDGGRGGPKPKTGYTAVVYFDPDFITETEVKNIPEDVAERHSKDSVIEVFEEL